MLLAAGCSPLLDQPLITAASSMGPTAHPLPTGPITRAEDPEHARLVSSYGGVYSNPKVEFAVARVVGRLVAASDDPGRSYRVTILNSPAVNAFALPTGDLYVTRGLIALANDESELAAVLAHEMGHVTAHHAAARQQRAQAIAVANRVVGNIVNDPNAAREARQTTEWSLAKFSQQQELEADSIGVRTLAGAGLDPYAEARFLTSMGRYAALPSDSGEVNQRPDFLSSHPSTPERVELAREQAARYGAPTQNEGGTAAYLERIDGLLYGDDPREGFLRGREFLNGDLGVGFRVPPGFAVKNTSAAVLATDGQATAIRFDSVSVPETTTLQDYLKSGWVNGLDPASIKTMTVAGLPAASAQAGVGGWAFRIGVARDGPTIYRFIFASGAPPASFDKIFQSTLASFRKLSDTERASLKPQRIRIVAAAPGDTVDSMAARMTGIDASRRKPLFEILNEVQDGEPLRAGQSYKLVLE